MCNESVCHAIFDCQQSNAIHPSAGIIAAAPRSSFADSFLWLCENSNQTTLSVTCASMWASWFGRNRIIMESKQCDLVQTSTSFVKMLHEYNGYPQKVVDCSAPNCPAPNSWRAPAVRWIKANFDAYIGTDCTRGLGVAFRNHEGSFMIAARLRED